jgi:transcriptional regulator with PAS, ATPase and Fis domain
MKSRELRAALSHARHGAELAELSGASGLQRNCFGNLAYVLCALGEYDEALQAFDRAANILQSLGTNSAAVLETAARIKLAQGRLSDCEQLLVRINDMARSQPDQLSYGHREAALTRAKLLARQGSLPSAIEQCDATSLLASSVADDWLNTQALFTKAEFMARLEQRAEALALIDQAVARLRAEPVDLFAQYERLVGTALIKTEQGAMADAHFQRARRVYVGTHDGPELCELQRESEFLTQQQQATASPITPTSILHDVVAALVQTGQPELLAREIANLLSTTRSAYQTSVLAITETGSQDILESYESACDAIGDAGAERRLQIGVSASRSVEVRFVPKMDVESLATVNSIRLLLSAAQELDRARAEREQALTIWPVDDEPPTEDGFILLGRMAELMTFAKRVAKAHITVLITGESGTGKEVLARAVHKYSDRAAKPFVPFNCAAIPRDLVESHLFGHRRGAFTGADRDQPGIIRGARGGTIFLDEVGELSLDLQPKLLRFLESGEIAPLGEASPSTVDVRVVAATNAKLEAAVNDGRFREDLFYRLNVVRLDIPPLRERRDEIGALVNHFVTATALEFGKGFVQLAEETMEHFLVHRWPGNVRQLQNEVRRIVALAEPNSVIPPTVLAPEILNRHLLAQPSAAGGDLAIPVRDKLMPTLSRIEREMIKVALREHGGRVEAAAKALGISRKGLYLKRQRLGL